jgi:hypothetical protein
VHQRVPEPRHVHVLHASPSVNAEC